MIRTEEAEQGQQNTISCGICYDDIKNEHSLGCQHAFCSECFTEYFESLILDQGKHNNLKCPEASCSYKPTNTEVKRIASPACYEKYLQFQSDFKVSLDKKTIFCSTPDCGGALKVKNAIKNKVACEKCKKLTCIKCKMSAE